MTDRTALPACAGEVTESLHSGPASLGFRQAACDQLAAAHLQVKFELGVDFIVHVRPAEAKRKALSDVHVQEGRRILVTAEENRDHSAVLAASRFRPAGVIR